MRQAIVTKFLGPTNYRGSRVKATAQAGSITLEWDHALNPDKNHLAAATALANRYDWLDSGLRMVGGALPAEAGYVYTFDDEPKAKVELSDWRDMAIDALIEERYEEAIAIISRDGDRSVNRDASTWSLGAGRSVLRNGIEVFTVARTPNVAISPHRLDNLVRRIVHLLNVEGAGKFESIRGGESDD